MKTHWRFLLIAGSIFLLILSFLLKDSSSPTSSSLKNKITVENTADLKPVIIPQEVVIKNISPTAQSGKSGVQTADESEVIVSEKPLPPKVDKAQKNKIGIEVRLYLRDSLDPHSGGSSGTGYVFAPGYIVTARHVFTDLALKYSGVDFDYHLESNGTEQKDYIYQFNGKIISQNKEIKFPLSMVAVGKLGTFKDLMILRVDDKTMDRARNFQPKNEGDINPYQALLNTATFNTDVRLREEVFMSGMHDLFSIYPTEIRTEGIILTGRRNWTYKGMLTGKNTDYPVNKIGVKIIYEVLGSAELGFSGGPAFNSEGELIGIIIEKDDKFVYIISSSDVLDFLRENKIIKN